MYVPVREIFLYICLVVAWHIVAANVKYYIQKWRR